jgi:hypothetical protein
MIKITYTISVAGARKLMPRGDVFCGSTPKEWK